MTEAAVDFVSSHTVKYASGIQRAPIVVQSYGKEVEI